LPVKMLPVLLSPASKPGSELSAANLMRFGFY
jgi:hypothetical protein